MNAKDVNFAYQVKHALDQNLDNLPASTAERLALVRKLAISRKKPEPLRVRLNQLAMAGHLSGALHAPLAWLGRFGVIMPLLVGTMVLIGMYEFEQEQRIEELAEMDVAVLSDDLPVSAYVDRGFNAYLATRDE